eukprot:TRINITY_DN7874_c0_g1_i8.p2 TRINITY_DN7874_c0_g1~~TRINITY_DN7874_c0_g1_i8.p2  ORF type:complete len:100 (-),score=40.23 TRINITY_DN7874_c0_g1_i8:143-442(-)
MILANKSDLATKQVAKDMGEKYAAEHNLMFLETSAKKDFQVSAAFELVAKKLIEMKSNPEEERRRRMNPGEERSGATSLTQTLSKGMESAKDKFHQCCV